MENHKFLNTNKGNRIKIKEGFKYLIKIPKNVRKIIGLKPNLRIYKKFKSSYIEKTISQINYCNYYFVIIYNLKISTLYLN